jgi:hypothetical protein
MAYDIVEKIQQMVAKAESTDSAAEAETIMNKVRDLLEKHGVSLLTITDRERRDLDPVGTSRDVYGFWAADSWVKKLSDAAAAYYGIRIVWTKRGNRTAIAAIGRESARAAFTAMMPYLRGQVNRLGQRGWANQDFPSVSKARHQIGIALALRMYAMVRERNRHVAASPKLTDGMNALVPVDLLELEMQEAFPDIKMANLWKSVPRPSYAAIVAAGEVNLADQLDRAGAPKYITGKR